MKEVLRRLLREPHRFFDVFIATFFMHLMGFAVILYSILVFNTYLPYGVSATLLALTIGVLIGLSLEFYFRGTRNVLMTKYYQDIVDKIASGLFKKILILPYDEIERSIHLVRNQAVESITHLLRPSLTAATLIVLDVPFAFIFLLLLFLIHPSLGLIAATFVFSSAAYAFYSRKQLAQRHLSLNLSERELAQLLGSVTDGAQTNRYTGELINIQEKWTSSLKHLLKRSRDVSQTEVQVQRIPAFILGLQSVILTAIGAVLVFDGKISIGALVGSNLLAAKIMMPVTNFFSQFESFNRIDTSIRCLQEIERLSEEVGNNTSLRDISGGLRVQDITYRFYGASVLALKSISFEIEQRDICVIHGSSGSGKTTLLQILAGLRRPLSGAVYVESINLQQISSDWWRGKVSYLPQEPTLTNGTLYQNFSIPGKKIREGELDQAILDSGLSDWFSSLHDGLDYKITDLGRQLSPGIRKKIALARIYLQDSRIYFLDEPSAGLDYEGRQRLVAKLNQLHHSGATLVLISQEQELMSGASILVHLGNDSSHRIYRNRTYKTLSCQEAKEFSPREGQS